MSETIIVPHERAGLELDEFLCLQFPEWNKGFLRRQVRGGRVLVDGRPALPSLRLRPDQVLMVEFEDLEAPIVPVAPDTALRILHEEEDYLVVDKPPGLAVEPERWARESPSLSGALLRLARERSDAGPKSGATGVSRGGEGSGELDLRFRIVHRIDKDTSGCVVVAKNLEAERSLRAAFEERRVEKRYQALVEGEHPLANGESETIDLPLGPDARKSGRMVVRESDGKPAQTRVSVAQRFRGYTLVDCFPVTGRTHQIRVHLAAVGSPGGRSALWQA